MEIKFNLYSIFISIEEKANLNHLNYVFAIKENMHLMHKCYLIIDLLKSNLYLIALHKV